MKKQGKWPVRLAWLFVVLCFLWSGYVTWNATEKLLDGDASSEMVLSSILAEDGRILTTRWHYSTELRVLNTQLVFAPLFHVFSDWHKIRFTGAMIMQLILLLSYGYYCQALGGKRIPCLIGAGLMLLPRSIAYGRIVLYHTYYMPHIILNFLLFALYIHLIQKEKGNSARFVFFLLLSFGVGLGGVRHGMITFAPLLLTVLLYVFRGITINKYTKARGILFFRDLSVVIMGCLSWMVGFLVNSRILSRFFIFENMNRALTTFPSANNIIGVFEAYSYSFGYDKWYELFSVRGLLSCSGLFSAVVFCLFAVRAYLEEEPDSKEWLTSAFCIAVHTTMIGSVLFLARIPQYELHLLPAFAFAIPTLALSVRSLDDGKRQVRAIFATAITITVLCIGIYHSLFFINPASRNLRYAGLHFQNKDNVVQLEDVAEYLEDKEYSLGYAPFWQASVLREMTDGHVKTLAMRAEQLHYHNNWLNEWQLNDPKVLNTEKSFLVAPNDDTDKLEMLATPQFVGSDYTIWTFETGEALWRYVNM